MIPAYPNPAPIEQLRQQTARNLHEFRQLRSRGTLCVEGNEQFGAEAVDCFLAAFSAHGEFLDNAITLLTEISTLDDAVLAEPGNKAIFENLIEPLSDSFDPELGVLYDSVMAQMIDTVRRLPKAAALNAALLRFETGDEASLLLRKARLRDPGRFLTAADRPAVCKVLILSRVTLGADVAITSVVLQKAQRIFPHAERVLIGPAKLASLFGGNPVLRIAPLDYRSSGGLIDRLLNWTAVVALIDNELQGLSADQYVIIDPDSRLLQLGMLPVVKNDRRYFFFESRRWESEFEDPLSVLTAKWLGQTFGTVTFIDPTVWLRESDVRLGAGLVQSLRGVAGPAGKPVVAISFGNGGNRAKSAPDRFEAMLLERLLQDGVRIVLDKGFGSAEARRAEQLTQALREKGFVAIEVREQNAAEITQSGQLDRANLLLWEGGIGSWAALIKASNEFIGYDSAGQHLAAAQRVPLIDIFIESSTAKFRSRWRPAGRGPINIIDWAGKRIDPQQMIADIMKARAGRRAN